MPPTLGGEPKMAAAVAVQGAEQSLALDHFPQSGQITCYLNRTYHVLLTPFDVTV